MKKTALFISICLLSFNSYSQKKEESIKELFHIMKQDSLMDKMFNSFIPTINAQMKKQYPDTDSMMKNHYDKIEENSINVMKTIMKKMLHEDIIPLYDKYFTQKDINDLIKFYKTPTGQKFINVTPELSKDLAVIMMQKYLPEAKKAMKEKLEDVNQNLKQ